MDKIIKCLSDSIHDHLGQEPDFDLDHKELGLLGIKVSVDSVTYRYGVFATDANGEVPEGAAPFDVYLVVIKK